MTYDYAAKGRADALAGLRDDKLYNLMEPHGEAYRNAHRLTRIGALPAALNDGSGFEHAGQTPVSPAAVVEAPSDEPPWVDEAPPQAKDEPPHPVPPAVPSSIEVEKTHTPEPDRTVGRPEPAAAQAPEPVAGRKPPYRVPLMAEIRALPKNGFRAISTFSGCGGSSLGYKIAGFEVLWASEFVPSAQETYRANHPGTLLDCRDIRDVKVDEILEATKTNPGELDLFDGSPPCASFSTAGIREYGWGRVKKYSDTKQRTDDLFFEFARLVKGVQAKVFVAENVAGLTVGVAKGMLGDGQIDAFQTQEDTILHTLMDCGYRVGFHVLDAADLGVPQARRRVIFVGIRKDRAARLVSIEPSAQMELQMRLSGGTPGDWVVADATKFEFEECDFIVCNLVLMFLPVGERASFLRNLIAKLRPGGAIVIVDKVLPPAGYLGTVLHRLTMRGKLDAGVAPEEILAKEMSLGGVQRPIAPHVVPTTAVRFFQFGEFVGWIHEREETGLELNHNLR